MDDTDIETTMNEIKEVTMKHFINDDNDDNPKIPEANWQFECQMK